jgi:hypothetical protein
MQMKKVVVTILAFLYLGLTTGLAVNIHYCMGKITSVELHDLKKEQPDACKTKMPCCGHVYHLVKVSDEHQQVATDLHTFENLIAQLSFPVSNEKITKVNAPPLLEPSAIYIQNCTFRI